MKKCNICLESFPDDNTKLALLPTPTTMDNMAPKTDKAIIKEMTVTRPGRTQLSNLRGVLARQMMPTPSTRDYK